MMRKQKHANCGLHFNSIEGQDFYQLQWLNSSHICNFGDPSFAQLPSSGVGTLQLQCLKSKKHQTDNLLLIKTQMLLEITKHLNSTPLHLGALGPLQRLASKSSLTGSTGIPPFCSNLKCCLIVKTTMHPTSSQPPLHLWAGAAAFGVQKAA